MEGLCWNCKSRRAHPEAFGLCEICDDLPGLYPLSPGEVGDAAEAKTAPEPEWVADPFAALAAPRKPPRL